MSSSKLRAPIEICFKEREAFLVIDEPILIKVIHFLRNLNKHVDLTRSRQESDLSSLDLNKAIHHFASIFCIQTSYPEFDTHEL